MPTLDRRERQRLRAIQAHLLDECLNAGAQYEQLSTVGVVYHPQQTTPRCNHVIPHHGVAWTRSADVTAAFEQLVARQRTPTFRFLESLFPQAFTRQLALSGLTRQARQRVWIFEPLYGPALPDEHLFGQPATTLAPDWQLLSVTSDAQRTTWCDLMVRNPQELVMPAKAQRWLAAYKGQPVAAGGVVLGSEVARVEQPRFAPHWHGFGLEAALLAAGIQHALLENCAILYTIEAAPANTLSDTTPYRQVGFERLTAVLVYGDHGAKAKDHDSAETTANLATPAHQDP